MFTFIDYEASTYGDYVFPGWADGIGWFLACLVISPIFIVLFYKLATEDDMDSPLAVSNVLILTSL